MIQKTIGARRRKGARQGRHPSGVGVGVLVLGAGVLVTAIALGGCAPLQEAKENSWGDLTPPVYLGIRAVGPNQVAVDFDEAVTITPETVAVSDALGASSARVEETSVIVETEHQSVPGSEYTLEGRVEDGAGNSTTFVASFYGFNADVPEVLINELTPQGSAGRPDVVELYLKTAGNLGGLTLYEGTPGEWETRYVFPAMELPAGAYVVVHYRPEGIPEEITEIDDPAESGGIDATDEAWDVWIPGGDGLTGNNGAITLAEQPFGRIVDAVLYSNRTSSSDTNYRGFGSSRMLAQAEELFAAGAWRAAGEAIAPEDCVDPEDSTATRSISRSSEAVDTNSSVDWHITPTRGATFGAVNTDEVYLP
jgi:hypothetical protein